MPTEHSITTSIDAVPAHGQDRQVEDITVQSMMVVQRMIAALTVCVALALLPGCGGSGGDGPPTETATKPATKPAPGPANGGAATNPHDHEHEEFSIGTVLIGAHEVELAQAHGAVEAGKEGHLVVKLPYSDNGATVVRAWIGTADRTMSFVGKGEYAPSHDDYDVHAMAPDPLPPNVMWWIELDRPDGTKSVGSVRPMLE